MITDTDVDPVAAPIGSAHWSRRLAPWLLVLLPFVMVAVWQALRSTGLEQDDSGQYLMHARALAEGRPYTSIAYIYSPLIRWIGPLAAPPGLPILLTAVYKLVGPNTAVMQGVMIACATAFVLLGGLYFARHDDRVLGLGVALLCGLPVAITYNASQILSDLPFCALIWSVIYLMDAPKGFTLWRILAIAGLGAAAIVTRTLGIALVPAMLVFALVHYRKLGIRAAMPLIIWVGTLLLVALFSNLKDHILVPVHPRAVAGWVWETRFGIASLHKYADAVLESHLHPFRNPLANDGFHVLTSVLMVVGILAWGRHALTRFGTIFALCYGGLLLLIPFAQPRYMWPLFPIYVFTVLNGARVAAQRWAHCTPRVARLAAMGFALVILPFAATRAMTARHQPYIMDNPEVKALVREIERDAARKPVRVTFYKPRSFGWATGLPTMGPLRGRYQCLLAELDRRQITHVITGTLNNERRGFLTHLAGHRPDLFDRTLATQRFAIYRFRSPGKLELARARENCARP